jgi:hypothetical protein
MFINMTKNEVHSICTDTQILYTKKSQFGNPHK